MPNKNFYDYTPETHITARELRERGWDIGEHIPDEAAIPRDAITPVPESFSMNQDEKDKKLYHGKMGAVITQPFRWIEGTVTFEE
jgi:hypothetical protein